MEGSPPKEQPCSERACEMITPVRRFIASLDHSAFSPAATLELHRLHQIAFNTILAVIAAYGRIQPRR
jgi:hypothetical protein